MSVISHVPMHFEGMTIPWSSIESRKTASVNDFPSRMELRELPELDERHWHEERRNLSAQIVHVQSSILNIALKASSNAYTNESVT